MDKAFLGRSDVEVSRICMGCMGFGDPGSGMHKWTLGRDESAQIIKSGLDNGITFFDTAMGYQGGTSEMFVGYALNKYARRDDVQVATKFIPLTPGELEAGVSAQTHIENMLDASLKRLGMDHVDLYILHMWEHNAPLYDVMEGLNRQVKAGKTRAIGVSNCFAWQLAEANALAEHEGFARFESIQGHYNLIFREEEREMARYCNTHGVSMTPYSALAAGRLCRLPGETSKRLEMDAYARGKYDASADADNIIIERVHEIAAKRGVSMTAVALSWLLTKVTAPVVGATKQKHIDGAVEGCGLKLTQEECAYLEETYIPHPLVGVMATEK